MRRHRPHGGTGELQIGLSRGVDDERWDRFVGAAPGGHYTQSSSWARYKATSGWRTARAIVSRDGTIVAGTQLLVRPFPPLGGVGYAFHGPVFEPGDDEVAEIALGALQRLCRRERVRYLVLQPSSGSPLPAELLEAHGYQPNDRFGAPSATARVDLTPEPEAILARMRRSTRANIRRGLARGLTARVGGDDDLDAVLALYAQAARRKGFPTASRSRYRAMWEMLGRRDGLAKTFLVADGDEVVSAQLGFRFGDTFYSHLMAWSGTHADRKPNELLDWTAMMWARANGCRTYDFEGAAGATAPAAPATGSCDDEFVSDYKRGFGAEVVPIPGHYDHAPNRLLRWGLHRVRPAIGDHPAVRRLERRLVRVASGRLREGKPLRNEDGLRP